MKTQYRPSQAVLSMDKIQKIIDATKNMRDRLIIETMYFGGLRRNEACNLMIEHINWDDRRIIVVEGKGNKTSPVPIGAVFPQYFTDLKHYLGNRKSGYVFLSNRNRRLEKSRVNQILMDITKELKMVNPNPNRKYINPHIFRHSLARHLKSLSFPAEFIQNYLRHSSIVTTMDSYGTLSIDEMEKIAENKRKLLE